MNNYKRKCLICGTDFETYKVNKRICAGDCRKKATAIYAKDFMQKKRLYERAITKPELERQPVLEGNVIL